MLAGGFLFADLWAGGWLSALHVAGHLCLCGDRASRASCRACKMASLLLGVLAPVQCAVAVAGGDVPLETCVG